MTKEAGRSTRASRIIKAQPDKIYDAFVNPAILVEWLPPADMTGKIHQFEARVGGGYRMSLFYPSTESRFRGKTAVNEDMVTVRFVELVRPHRIVEAVTFHAADPALMGEMTLVATFEEVSNGTKVSIVCSNLPPGLSAEDNEAGTQESLEKLAQRFG